MFLINFLLDWARRARGARTAQSSKKVMTNLSENGYIHEFGFMNFLANPNLILPLNKVYRGPYNIIIQKYSQSHIERLYVAWIFMNQTLLTWQISLNIRQKHVWKVGLSRKSILLMWMILIFPQKFQGPFNYGFFFLRKCTTFNLLE